MTEKINQSERFPSRVCEENFKKSVARLHPIGEFNHNYSPELLGVVATKLTSVVIANVDKENPRVELFLEYNPRSGYKMCDHDHICNEHDIDWVDMPSHFGLYFESADNKKYVIFDPYFIELGENIDSVESDFERERIISLVDAFDRYGIDIIITRASNDRFMSLAWKSDKFIGVEDYGQQIDKFINDEWTSNLAMELGWTNTELLRFKLVNELPPKKH